jgi:hypothetical protein
MTDTGAEPSKAELIRKVDQLESEQQTLKSQLKKLMPSRRDALKAGAAATVGIGALGVASDTAESATGSAGTIGSSSDRPDIFADEIDANAFTGQAGGGANLQACRVFLSSDQSISAGAAPKVQYDSVVFDSDSNFDTGTHNWTCPETGLYMVNHQVSFNNGRSGDKRTTVIGTATSLSNSDEGAKSEENPSNPGARIQTSTVNRYQSGDTIAGYARNLDSNDTLEGSSFSFSSFLEVSFLGGL